MDVDSLPIDIHSSKLVDWLVSRRHCPKDWQKNVSVIREKINRAIQDMPENEKVVELLSGSYILKETEADSKNIFGRYSSQRMKDWQEIIRHYESDGSYLVDSAQLLQRYVAYEIPSAKKQIAKCHSGIEECARKQNDYLKLSKDAEKQFKLDCENMSIEGKKIKCELLRLTIDLPKFFENFVKHSSNLKEAAEYYKRFRKAIMKCDALHDRLLPMLNFVILHGNVTYFQWKTGRKPEIVRDLFLEKLSAEETTEEKQANAAWSGQGEDSQEAIDFDIPDEEIDFGSVEEISLEDSVVSGITIEDGQSSTQNREVSDSEFQGNTASGTSALTILEHPETHQLFVTDLKELEAFLKSRMFDLNTTHASDILLGGSLLIQEGGQTVSSADIRRMLSNVQNMLGELTKHNLKRLLKIRVQPHFLDSLTEQLKQKQNQAEKYQTMSQLMKTKEQELRKELQQRQSEFDLLAKRAKQLQKKIENEVSKKYSNRPVNIMGGITSALASSG